MNGLLRRPIKGMAYPTGYHYFDHRLGKTRFASGSAGGKGQAAI